MDCGPWISAGVHTRESGGGNERAECLVLRSSPRSRSAPSPGLRGRVGEGVASTNLVCPLPVPPPQAGEQNAPSALRGRKARRVRRERTESGAEPNAPSRVVRGEDQRGRDPC